MPGSYYLTESIELQNFETGIDKSITIAADRVSVDLMGFTLTSNCVVIKAEPGSEDLTIQNGTVRSLDCAAIELGARVRLLNLDAYAGGTARGITLGDSSFVFRTRGVGSDDGTGIKVGRNSVIKESFGKGAEDGAGIEVGADSLVASSMADASGFGIGIIAATGTVVQDCTVKAEFVGIGGGAGTVITNSSVRASDEAAIYLGPGGSVRGTSVQADYIAIQGEGDGIVIADNICSKGPEACIRVRGANNRIERNHLDGGRILVEGSGNLISQNTVGGLVRDGIGGGAFEIGGARNLLQANTVTGSECGILFAEDGGHVYRDNVFMVTSQAICGPPNIDGGDNVVPSTSNCGDGLRQGIEVCDGVDLGGRSCQSEGLEGTGLSCNSTCDGLDTSACSVSICGSGTRRGPEACDPPDFGGVTCETLGFNGGTLRCVADCSAFNTSECCCTDGRAGCPPCPCGNGTIDPQEACDGTNLGGQTCISRGFESGVLACNASCTEFDVSGCVGGGSCGNGIRETDQGEECDLNDLGGATCVSRAFDGGSLACRLSCEFDTSGCVFVCGNGVRRGTEVCDGVDLDDKTCNAFGFDAGTLGCTSDCSAFDLSACGTVCGNGMRSGNEICDGADVGSNTCQSQGYDAGTLGCSVDCSEYETDGCCCTGGQQNCTPCPVCGNNVREAPFELCDGSDLGGETCSSQGRPPGTLACNSTCDGFIYAGCEGLLRKQIKGANN